MSPNFEFEEERIRPVRPTSDGSFVYNRYDPRTRISSTVRFLMKARIVRNEEQARAVLLVLLALLISAAVFLIWNSTRTPQIVQLHLIR